MSDGQDSGSECVQKYKTYYYESPTEGCARTGERGYALSKRGQYFQTALNGLVAIKSLD